MSSLDSTITVEQQIRLCVVDGEVGYFHRWAQYSEPDGKSYAMGIIELADETVEVSPSKIIFVDEDHKVLLYFKSHPEAAAALKGDRNGEH